MFSTRYFLGLQTGKLFEKQDKLALFKAHFARKEREKENVLENLLKCRNESYRGKSEYRGFFFRGFRGDSRSEKDSGSGSAALSQESSGRGSAATYSFK